MNYFKEKRILSGKKQREVTAELNMNPIVLSQIECGKTVLATKYIKKFCKSVGADENEVRNKIFDIKLEIFKKNLRKKLGLKS